MLLSECVRRINNHKYHIDYHPPLDSPTISVPFGVPKDALEQNQRIHDVLAVKWGLLQEAFEEADTDNDGHLSLQEFMTSIKQAPIYLPASS